MHTTVVRSRHLPSVFALLFSIGLVYLPAVTSVYGMYDDFPQLLEPRWVDRWILPAWIRAARPLGGVLTEYSFAAAHGVEGLAGLRLLGLAILLVFGILLYLHLVKLTGARFSSAALAIFICTLPPFQVLVGWASMWLYLLPAVFTFFAYRLAVQAVDGNALSRSVRLFLSVAILYICFNIYPPTTMFIWFWYVVELLSSQDQWSLSVRKFIAVFSSVLVSAVAYISIYRALGLAHERGHLSTAYLAKCKWFILSVVPKAARLQWFSAGPAWAVLIALLAVAAVVLRKEPMRAMTIRGVLLAAAVPLSYLPLLAAAEFDISFRALAVLAGVIGFAAWAGLMQIAQRVGTPKTAVWIIMCIVVTAGALRGSLNLRRSITGPNAFEYAWIRKALLSQSTYKRIVFLRPDLATWLRRAGNHWDEFHETTSITPVEYRTLPSMAALILADSGIQDARVTAAVVVVDHDHPVPPQPDDLTVDLQPMADTIQQPSR